MFKICDKSGLLQMGNSHKVRLDSGVELSFNDAKHYTYFKLGLATQLYLLTTSKHFTGILFFR